MDTFEELFDVEWEDESPEDIEAFWYAQIDYEEVRDGKLVDVNVLDDLLEPFRTGLLDALGIKKPTDTQNQAIYKALSRAFGSGCITTKRQDKRHLKAATDKRTRKAIQTKELLWHEYQMLGCPSYADISQHMLQEHGIKIKPSTCGQYIRRRLKQEDKK
jgi:hypothetical protein